MLDGQVPEEFDIQAQAVEALPAEEVADLYRTAVAGGAVVGPPSCTYAAKTATVTG